MSKGRKTNKAAKPKRKARTGAVGQAMAALDSGAAAFRRLLLDPCNAPMVGPAYGGVHSGIYRRYRNVYTIPAAVVETVFVWQPGTNTLWQGGHSSANAGNAITLNGGRLFTGLSIGNNTEWRALSACVKVRYIGAESARAGVVGLATGHYFYAPATTGVTAITAQSQCPYNARLGETLHEVKFVPTAGDELFTQATYDATLRPVPDKSTIMVTLKGVPAGSVQFEFTAVVEQDAFDSDNSTTTAVTAIEPASSNTLSQVLRSMGPVTNWAFHHVVVPTIRSVASGAVRTIGNTASAASSGMRLLTL